MDGSLNIIGTVPVNLQLAAVPITGESPLPMSGGVEIYGSVVTVANNLQYDGAIVTGERPLPISGGVEIYGSITTVANNLQYGGVAVTGERPLPVSGLVEFAEPVSVSDLKYDSTAVTRESPLPISGTVDGFVNIPPTNMQIGGLAVSVNDPVPGSGALSGPDSSPLIYRLELQASGVEYSQALPGPLYGFDVQASGAYDMWLAFVTREIAAHRRVTIKSGASYGKEFMRTKSGLTLFLASDFDDNVEASRGAEIVAWTE